MGQIRATQKVFIDGKHTTYHAIRLELRIGACVLRGSISARREGEQEQTLREAGITEIVQSVTTFKLARVDGQGNVEKS